MEREFWLNDVIRRGFVKGSDGFLQLRVFVEAVSLKDGRRLAASNLSYDTVADYIYGTVDSRLKSGCMPEAGMLTGQESNFLFAEEDMRSLGLTSAT
jgi:hypothetical protein